MNHAVLPRFALLVVAFTATFIPLSSFARSTERISQHISECHVGFNEQYKVGHWTPIRVTVSGIVVNESYQVDLTTVDCDGVDVTFPVGQSTSGELDQGVVPMHVYAKMGRVGAPIRVTLRAGEKVLDERELRPGQTESGDHTLRSLRPTCELILHVGSEPIGLAEAFPDREASAGVEQRRVVRLSDIDALSTDWFGYEAVDVLVLSAGDGSMARRLAGDKRRFAAMRKWVEMGGRLVVLCGGRGGQELLAEGGPFASLVPGTFVREGRLPDSDALEHYAQSDAEIVARGARSEVLVPQLDNISGRVELYGAAGEQLPLVIRAPRGLGEITFAGIDLDAPPLAGWSGRTPLLRALLRPFMTNSETGATSRALVTTGYDDLNGALRQRLGQTFAGVRPVSFRTVLGFSILYLLALFPLNYFLVHRWLRRPWLAWVTLPVILIAFGAGAFAFAGSRSRSSGPTVNQVELVDIDVASGQARGTLWATVYSPNAKRYELALDVKFAAGASGPAPILSWHGLAGAGIGGMSGGGPEFGGIAAGYRSDAQRELSGVPVLAAATKSLTARWLAESSASINAKLSDDQGTLAGSISNASNITLRNARLLYGAWAYRLKDLEPGAIREFNEEIAPITALTLLTGLALGENQNPHSAVRAQLPVDRSTAGELLNVMMFYDAAGGAGFAGLPLKYQADCNLSRHLQLGQAVLVADVAGPTSYLTDAESGSRLGDGDSHSSQTIYRFVLPVLRSGD